MSYNQDTCTFALHEDVIINDSKMIAKCRAYRVDTKPGLWNLDWIMDSIFDLILDWKAESMK